MTKSEEDLLRPARAAELAEKKQQLQQFLLQSDLDGLLITRHENIAWATAGLVDVRVGLMRETGAAALLVMRDGRSFYLTSANEAPRLAREEFAGLDFQPLIDPWYAHDVPTLIRKAAGAARVGADDAASGLPLSPMKSLRLSLTEGEIERYRWLGRNVADAVTDVLGELRPGLTEVAMRSMVAARLLERDILPSVLLTACDERIRSYRHAVPRGGVLRNLGMLNVCARRWGLTVSMTRFVHFGPMPAELEQKFRAAAAVNAALLDATREGASSDKLFGAARGAYASQGFAGEEELHHQGGATGYWEREWIARPGGAERVADRQAFAWNPSIGGAKSEDTVVLQEGKIEVLTGTPRLPVWDAAPGHGSAGVLLL